MSGFFPLLGQCQGTLYALSAVPGSSSVTVTVSLPHERRHHGLSSIPCLSSPVWVTSRIDCSHSEPCSGVDCGRHSVRSV